MKITPPNCVAHGIEYQRLHLPFMVAWWSGEVLATMRNPAKAEAARQALARLS